MKQSLIKIGKNDFTLKDFKPSKGNGSDSLGIFKEKMQQMWSMYEEQLQRNFELMQVINRQQQIIQQVTSPGELITVPLRQHQPVTKVSTEVSSGNEGEFYIEPLHYKKLNELSTHIKQLNIAKRTDAANSIVNFLYVLGQFGGKASAEKLFRAADIADPTGFRYISILRKQNFIAYKGIQHHVMYELTEKGKQFLEGKINYMTEFHHLSSVSKAH